MSKHQFTDIRVAIEPDNPSIQRLEFKCIKCGACKTVCTNDIGVCGTYDLRYTNDVPVCINCGQCANVCPVDSITEKFEIYQVAEALRDPEKIVIVTTSPSVRVALGEEFGLADGSFVEGKMIALLKKLGADYVLDTNFAADLTIMEEASELARRLQGKDKKLPQFTSCCPAWVKFMETYYPDMLEHLSTAKSPIGMQGPTIKTYFAKKMGIDPHKIVNVALTPCTAKKFEIRRDEMCAAGRYHGDEAMRDMDFVITTREVAMLAKDEKFDFDRYLDYMHGQVKELVTNYGKLDLLWFDFSYDDMCGEKWRAEELIRMVRMYQPDVIIDNRLEVSGEGRGSLYDCNPTPYHGDFVSPEQIIPPEGICDKEGNPMVWEACFTMNNNWGYCANDHYYKPASMLIKKLVECVSKGGNMILNVGPDAKGKFPKESSAILAEIGRWMDKNHDSIYGCAPATDIPKPDYGRITRNGNKYYVHIYENTLGPLPLIGFDKNKIVKVRALDDGHEVPISTLWVHSDYPDIAFVDLGPDPVLPDPVDYVLEVEMAE